jgi:hypothetical protein
MDENDFESWFVPSPRRLRTLDSPKHALRLISACLLGLACVAGIAWWMLS